MREVTEIRLDEYGDEYHESWLLVRANRITSTGTRLFDSEITHREYVYVNISRCRRRRSLKSDYLSAREVIAEFSLSQSQWGAFVSSFGDGSGIPATLTYLLGEEVPSAPAESRLDESYREVRGAAHEAMGEVADAYKKVAEAFEGGKRRELRDALRTLQYAIENSGPNVEFAAKSLAKHTENVVAKARADIEGMVAAQMEQAALAQGEQRQLDRGGE